MDNITRQMLHAEILGFTHPDSGRYVKFEAPRPKDMVDFLDWLAEYQNNKR